MGHTEGPQRSRVVPLDRDRALVEAARRDPAAFEPLYRKYVAQVYNLAVYELHDPHEAEDATERTFLSALAALPTFRERATASDGDDASTFKVWLFRIARNAIAERRRALRRHPETTLDAVLDARATTDVEAIAVRNEAAAAAWTAIAELPDDRRQAVVLRFVHELTTAEIATILGRSEGAVRVLIHRGLRRVAERLGERP
ncbi:MAG: RNA polymerase sigma factor [Candidatus Limnocylindria bacterium]